jgi:hypothetical protein
VVNQMAIAFDMGRPVGEQRRAGSEFQDGERIRGHLGLCLLRGEVLHDRVAVVFATGPTDFVELGMQQLFESLAAATDTGMMQFDFQRLEFRQQRMADHGQEGEAEEADDAPPLPLGTRAAMTPESAAANSATGLVTPAADGPPPP